ncbi:MAG: hypothetical protein KME03_11770 [Aphanocapsa lilacina HA4352-LM1]|jgi:hypothetical protein|nr:hypothetical protein [Aphanocapsa lilacina HA4352-LM1]
MQGSTVRISASAHRILKKLAARSGESMQTVLDRAVEEYRRGQFLEEANRAFAALRDDPEARQAELAEREIWGIWNLFVC